jgi:hypothetical protein
MSKSLVVTKGTLGPTVRINPAVAEEIDSIAAERQVKMEILVNEILERYVASQSVTKKQDGVAFLLSIARMFDSGASNASENVRAIVTDFLL